MTGERFLGPVLGGTGNFRVRIEVGILGPVFRAELKGCYESWDLCCDSGVLHVVWQVWCTDVVREVIYRKMCM